MFRNLDALTNEEKVLVALQENIPEQVSKVSKILICRDPLTQISRGICYLNFDNLVDSMNTFQALEKLESLQIDSREGKYCKISIWSLFMTLFYSQSHSLIALIRKIVISEDRTTVTITITIILVAKTIRFQVHNRHKMISSNRHTLRVISTHSLMFRSLQNKRLICMLKILLRKKIICSTTLITTPNRSLRYLWRTRFTMCLNQ